MKVPNVTNVTTAVTKAVKRNPVNDAACHVRHCEYISGGKQLCEYFSKKENLAEAKNTVAKAKEAFENAKRALKEARQNLRFAKDPNHQHCSGAVEDTCSSYWTAGFPRAAEATCRGGILPPLQITKKVG